MGGFFEAGANYTLSADGAHPVFVGSVFISQISLKFLVMHSPEDEALLAGYRRNLYLLILVSSGIDVAATLAGGVAALPTLGGSFVVEEVVEWIISGLLAKNKLELKKRYKIVGLLPVPGLTSLSIQCVLELRALRRRPKKILERLKAA
jgi:hypothetical protein